MYIYINNPRLSRRVGPCWTWSGRSGWGGCARSRPKCDPESYITDLAINNPRLSRRVGPCRTWSGRS